MGLHDSFGHMKHKLWSKERSEIKLAIWLLTIKNRVLIWFPRIQVACDIPLEISWRWPQLCFRLHCNRKSACEVMCPKVTGVPVVGISGLPFGSPGRKCHLDLAPVEICREYYKGEGGDFPQIRAVVSLVSSRLPVARPYTKSAQTMH
jgi:hypothetical protein